MTASPRPAGLLRSTSRAAARTALAVAALVLLALPTLALPAQAHDVLVAAEPADGAVLDASPERVHLTFSGNILEVSPVIVVSDSSGAVVAEGTAEVAGPDVTLPIGSALPDGAYDVAWRVVSSDGHPIEGTFAFTVAAPTPAAPTPAPTPAATLAGSTDDVESAEAPTTSETPADGLQALPLWVRLLLAAAATGAVVALIVLVARQLRENR